MDQVHVVRHKVLVEGLSWAGWVWFLTMRSLFFAITTVPLARVGWAINVLTALAIVATPLGGPGTLRWVMRMALLIGAAGLIVLATGRAIKAWQPRAIAGAVIVAVAAAQLYALASFDQVEGRESVMSGW
jgi:cytochrome c oxidase subunit IV